MDRPCGRTITILCSGVALGVYVPALLLSHRLGVLGASTETVVLESLFFEERRQRILANKAAFHKDFQVARMGQRMARQPGPNLDPGLTARLLERWRQEDRGLFIAFSGFWMPLLETYRRHYASREIWVHQLHMDAAVSTSWKNAVLPDKACQPVWLFNHESRRLCFRMMDNEEVCVPLRQRPEQVLVHGGGWGMGTYRDAIPVLQSRGMGLDIIAYNEQEAAEPEAGQRFFMVDPAWTPWSVNQAGAHVLPPFGEIKPGTPPEFKSRPESHELLGLARNVRAIVSKPGGATLLDSLTAATPLVTLEPFGDYEAKNAAFWQDLGFGISFADWKKADFSLEALEPLHRNLLKARGSVPEYAAAWLPQFTRYLDRGHQGA